MATYDLPPDFLAGETHRAERELAKMEMSRLREVKDEQCERTDAMRSSVDSDTLLIIFPYQ